VRHNPLKEGNYTKFALSRRLGRVHTGLAMSSADIPQSGDCAADADENTVAGQTVNPLKLNSLEAPMLRGTSGASGCRRG